jgi:translation initiation factor 1
MGKKKKKRIATDGMVYSTDPEFAFETEGENEEKIDIDSQLLTLRRDRKQRKGKVVTLIEGFVGPEDDLKDLAKELKTHCGSGGSAKHGEILIQGDFLDKISEKLKNSGYKVKKIG